MLLCHYNTSCELIVALFTLNIALHLALVLRFRQHFINIVNVGLFGFVTEFIFDNTGLGFNSYI
jgi:hypothetical protein